MFDFLSLKESPTDAFRLIKKKCETTLKNKCFLSRNEIDSNSMMNEVLNGDRVFYRSESSIKGVLIKQLENGEKCGFHISKSNVDQKLSTLLFNKHFDKYLKRKIDHK